MAITDKQSYDVVANYRYIIVRYGNDWDELGHLWDNLYEILNFFRLVPYGLDLCGYRGLVVSKCPTSVPLGVC